MATEDHFNWPAANKTDTMYLATLTNNEPGFQKRNFYKDTSSNLDIRDIEKARPHYQGTQFNNKESYLNRNDDIAGSAPKKLHQPLEKVYYGLKNEDIIGTKPKCNKFSTTRAVTNPLNPDYKLPYAEVRQATPPKFVRDNIDIKDIDGARPNPYNKYNITRVSNLVNDIDGARPKKEWIPAGKPSSLDVRDINYHWEFHTKRQTNPLSPRYKVVNEEKQLIEYGELDNKPPVRHPKEVNKVTSSDLKTDDISGAQASTAVQHITKMATRNDYLKTADIPGAQVASLKKGMSTKRETNPIWPSYTVPGHTEPDPYLTRNSKPTDTTTKYGVTGSSMASAKSGTVVSPQKEAISAYSGFDNKGITLDNAPKREDYAASRKSSNPVSDKTPTSQGAGYQRTFEARPPSPLIKTGENVLNGGKMNFDYIPARQPGEGYVASDGKRKSTSGPTSGPTGTLDAKRTLNSNDVYQKNVKNFFGVSGADDSKRPMSNVEKLDSYIRK